MNPLTVIEAIFDAVVDMAFGRSRFERRIGCAVLLLFLAVVVALIVINNWE